MKKKGQVVLNEDYELVPTSALKPHPRNVNRGDLSAIGESIVENGFYGAIVAQHSTRYILAGNHRFEAAKGAGLAKVPVVWVDVDDARALRILLADNRTTRLGADDQEALAALLQEILGQSDTLAGTGYDTADLDELLAELGSANSDAVGLTDEDAAPSAPEYPVPTAGDIWVLGKHRLLCGDLSPPAGRGIFTRRVTSSAEGADGHPANSCTP
jgi:ParB-like chromosome segregation protein Spo0J